MHRFFLLALTLFSACEWPAGPGGADFDIPITGNYHLSRSSAHQIIITTEEGQIVIPAKVLGLWYDSQYIAVKQKDLKYRWDNPKDMFVESDPSIANYWIIDVHTNEQYGPMKASDFKKKALSLEFSERIQLRSPEPMPTTDTLVTRQGMYAFQNNYILQVYESEPGFISYRLIDGVNRNLIDQVDGFLNAHPWAFYFDSYRRRLWVYDGESCVWLWEERKTGNEFVCIPLSQDTGEVISKAPETFLKVLRTEL